jgi:uncharacterized membrane-anchored protein
LVLIAIFWFWNRVEGTLSIDSISTQRREVFYWLTVVTTFALGTATGDMTAHSFHWGFLPSGLIFALLFILPGVAYRFFKFNSVLAFWLSYIITRPFGASFADYYGAAKAKGGLGYGYGSTALILTAVIVLLVALQGHEEQKA